MKAALKTAGMLASVLVLLMLTSTVSAISVVNPTIQESHLSVVPIRYDPYPAESGKYLQLWVKVENGGTTPDSNGHFKIDPSYPFSLNPGETGEQTVGTINVGSQVVLAYTVRIDALALTSEYNSSLWLLQCFDATCSNAIRFPISVYIRRPNPIVEIASVASSPSVVVAGEKFAVAVKLQVSGSRIKDVTATLNLSSVPFSPVSSSTERQIEAIDSGKDATVTFDLITTGSASSSTYKVPITIAYSDEVGNSFTKSDYVTLTVGGEPNLLLVAEDKTMFRKGTITEFVVSIVNKGLVDVKLLSIKLIGGSGYRMLSPDELYIGSLKSDDYETAKFKIYVDSNSTLTLPFEFSFMDALNNDYTQTKQISYLVIADDEAARLGLYSPDNGWIFFVVLGLLVIFAIYRMRRKKK